MRVKQTDRVLVGLPGELGNLLRSRAKASYRSVSNETVMLIEAALAAEAKTASNPTV